MLIAVDLRIAIVAALCFLHSISCHGLCLTQVWHS
jgi:hypothetical protein